MLFLTSIALIYASTGTLNFAQLAERMGVMGTPTFIIGGEMLRGVPQTGLADAVEQIRALEG